MDLEDSDVELLIKLHKNQTNGFKNSKRSSFHKTIATIFLAGIIGLAGIWLTWLYASVYEESQSDLVLTDDLDDVTGTCMVPDDARYECWPQAGNVTKEQCTAKGCCWAPIEKTGTVPWCFYPSGYQIYHVKSLEKKDTSYYLTLEPQRPSGWPKDTLHVAVDITMETRSRLHIKIFDRIKPRYEVPLTLTKALHFVSAEETDYVVDIPSTGPFYISVTRRSTGQILFSTRNAAPLIFADQYLQIGTKLSSKFIYGLGEHADRFPLSTDWNRKVLFARDQGPNPVPGARDANLYGTHPFYLNMEAGGNAHGVFLLNSNAMEVELQPEPSLTFRTVGGILDLYIFSGPTPDSIVEQYTDIIGRPFMPPYWAFGFQLSRYGYESTKNLSKIINRMRAAKMNYDAQWTDIDAMRAHLDWTYDAEGKWKGLDEVVKDLHAHGQRYNILIDPIMSINQTPSSYSPYPDGLKANVYVKAPDGKTNLVGNGWPGQSVWVDFFHPNATAYWTKQAQKFYDEIPYDAFLIDMNEPSNFGDGSIHGCPNSSYEDPPFVPRGLSGGKLRARTLCMTAKQYPSIHYNLHSLYGHSESIVTKRALDSVVKKRSIVITRSSYPGTGVHAGHWSGDISSTWAEMNYSIPGMLNFQMFGIPLWGADICGFGGKTTPELCTRWMQLGTFYPFMWNHNCLGEKMFGIPLWGADICGFGGNTTPELCTRWMQLGTFYPFMWNHNRITQKDQDPACFAEDVQARMRQTLQLRYLLIPYLNTLFYRTHVDGTPIVRPLFFQYPNTRFNETYYISDQFMWGTTLLITPALREVGRIYHDKAVPSHDNFSQPRPDNNDINITLDKGYLPADRWYDFYSYRCINSPGMRVVFDIPIDRLNIQVRGGSIIPMQLPEVTTTLSRKNDFVLLVALAADTSATGELYCDDGESLDSISSKKYNLISFNCSKNKLTSTVVQKGYSLETMILGQVSVLGVRLKPYSVTVNGQAIKSYQYTKKALQIAGLKVNLLEQLTIEWS